ncbi:MAG TPA: alpha/beta fold hydrolase [Candidatus Baltobacteraceae bacterium]
MLPLFGLLLAAASASPANVTCAAARAFTGTVCVPSSSGKHPAILLLGGSEGGDSMAQLAKRFAGYGYVAASVAYFGAPGLPKTLENIPVETIGTALDGIAKREDVDPDKIAVLGGSKGGELALLVASTYPQIHAVVADVPSPFAWEGIAAGPGAPESSWTIAGKPVPYVPYTSTMGAQFMNAYTMHQPLDLRKGYDAAMMENEADIAPAMFPLQNIHGPVLLLAGDDDQIWNSQAQCALALAYLQQHHHAYADKYVHYAGAGHMFLFARPGHADTQAALGPMTLLLGGSEQSNVAAANAAWPLIGEFLQQALRT